MLGRLLKYELRATAPFMSLLTVALLGSAGLSRLFTYLAQTLDADLLPIVLTGIVTLFYTLLACSSLMLVYAMLIYRFGTNLFGGAGYLTLTLPVKRTTLLNAKLIIGLLCVISAIIVLIGSLCILFSSELGAVINEMIPAIGEVITYSAKLFGIPLWLMLVYLSVMLLFGLIQGVLTLYCSVAIGQLFTGHVILGSFIGYVAIGAVTRTASSLLAVLLGIASELEKLLTGVVSHTAAAVPSTALRIYLLSTFIMTFVITTGLYHLTRRILKRSVNLQ